MASRIPSGFRGDFKDKPGVFMVGPGQKKQAAMTITLEGS